MTKTEIEEIIVQTLQELQNATGLENSEIKATVVPLSDLGFFDSLLAIETTLVLEERFGCSCGEDSVFRDKETSEPLAISDIASRLAQKLAAAA
jgi:acyl carrier protein